MSGMNCPRCHTELPPDSFYGPCGDCRDRLRARATEAAANRSEPDPAADVPLAVPPAMSISRLPDTGINCRLCGDPLDYPTDAHPCCVIWIEGMGFDRCWACAEAKRTGRVYEPLRLPKPRSAA